MAEAAFSEDGKYYSAITQDGRLRIWDTETNILKQEYTPDLHLSSPPSCLQWINVTLSATSQKRVRRKSISEQGQQCIALGTFSGKIFIYSVSQAKVETVLVQKGSNSSIQSLDWHRKYGLFSCTANSFVQEWDLQSSSVIHKYNINLTYNNKQGSKVSAIRLVSHSQDTQAKFLVAVAWQVRLWRLHNSSAVTIKCFGHTAAPRALLTVATLNKSCWLIEGSQTERLLSFWDVTISDNHLPQVNSEEPTPIKELSVCSITTAPVISVPTYNFVLEDAPRFIDVKLKIEDDEATKLSLVASTRSGVVHYYGLTLNGESTKPIKPSLTIQVTTEDAQPLPLQCCQLPPMGDDVLLGYSNGPALVFEKVTPDTKTKTQVLIRGESVVKEGKKRKGKQNESSASGEVTYVEPMGGVSRKRATPGGKLEVSMEARLANLTVDIKSRSKAAVNQNLTKLLMQGLHSKDKGLILTVLQKDDPAVASNTVSSLPADYVPQLLEQLVDMATRKTNQCSSVCTWLTAVLRSHSALLLATINSKTSDHLTQLLAIFTHRRSHLCQLLNLKGRVELTMSQRTADTHTDDQQPVLDYNDSSSDEEMEVERYQSGSEHSWEDEVDGDSHSSSHSDLSDN